MDFATATALIRKTAAEFGYKLIKALDETSQGGTGPHAHYVFGGDGAPATAGPTTSPVGQVASAIGNVIGGKPAAIITQSIKAIADFGSAIAGTGQRQGTPTPVGPNGEIIVTGQRPKAAASSFSQITTAEAAYNALGKQLGGNLDKLFGTKFLGSIGSKLGTGLQGAGYGQMSSSVLGLTGLKQSNLGASLGGAAGGIIGSMIPGVGTAIGGLIGGALGGTLGGLFVKQNFARANISGSGGVITSTPGMDDHGAEQKQAASDMGSAVTQGIQGIADQLGAMLGNFAVSIGVDKKGQYVVDPTGAGWISNRSGGPQVQTFGSAQEAVSAAIADAIKDGAITGISAASQTILRRATDLQKALNKVLVIESIPRRLLALTNPVKAAIMDLNKEFSQMISYLKEGGATAEQFAQAQQLYDLERQKAIEQAASGAGTQIQDYINEMLGGQNSPLNKRTVYENAQATLAPLAADVNAGKAVDADAFLKAVQNFQQASQELNGSSSSFFGDFDALLTLLGKAKENIVGSTATDTSNLPASPFDDAGIQAIIHGTTGTIDAITNQTNVLGGLLQQLINNGYYGSGGGGGGSAIDILPDRRLMYDTEIGAYQ
jgi:hypothetical protein